MRSRYRIRDYSFSESLENESCLVKYFRLAESLAFVSHYGMIDGSVDLSSRNKQISNVNLSLDELKWAWLDNDEKFEDVLMENLNKEVGEFEELENCYVVLATSLYNHKNETCMICLDRDKEEFNIIYSTYENIDKIFPNNWRDNFLTNELYKLKSDDLGQYVQSKAIERCKSCHKSESKLYLPEMFCQNCEKKEVIADGVN
jgi:hypothetical protein